MTKDTILMTIKTMHSMKEEKPLEEGLLYDLDMVIVGGGVAGLSAGIFAARRGLKPVIITSGLGGQTAATAEIENYPACGPIEGPDLVKRFYDEALHFGCTMVNDEVLSIIKDGDLFLVTGRKHTLKSLMVIIASGKSPRKLDVPGEDALIGRKLFYAGAFDEKQFLKKRIAIIGGGNSALDIATRFSAHASSVVLIHRRDSFSGEAVLLERLSKAKNIERIMNSRIKRIDEGDEHVSLTVSDDMGNEQELDVDAIIVAAGFEARNDMYKDLVNCTDEKTIIIDDQCRTNCEGVWAAGDCTTVPFQQIVISAGEGAKAALSAAHYYAKKSGKRMSRVDWGFRS